MDSPQIPVALTRISSYDSPSLKELVFQTLEAANINFSRGSRILVKPNLLLPLLLASTHPEIVGTVCEWLIEQGCKIEVSDSPGFGTAMRVARVIGLVERLKSMNIPIVAMDRPRPEKIRLPDHDQPIRLHVSQKVRECDYIFSICKIKAHSQMRITLAVKNCFGCIPGIRKALVHALHAPSTDYFADCIAAFYQTLPPVLACADGITVMTETGPSKGKPLQLGLFAASKNAVALDNTLLSILNITPEQAPLTMALKKISLDWPFEKIFYPLEQPCAFANNGFSVPETLAAASFNPFRLTKSLCRRLWLAHFK